MTEAMHGALFEQVAARAGVAPGQAPADLLAQLAQQDPRMALLAGLLAQRNTEVSDADLDDEPAPGRRDDTVARVRRRVRDLCEQVSSLRARNDAFAAAVGACSVCWGENAGCLLCGGDGTAGSMPVDPDGFLRYVAPAVRNLTDPSWVHLGQSREAAEGEGDAERLR